MNIYYIVLINFREVLFLRYYIKLCFMCFVVMIFLFQGCSKPGNDDFSKVHKMLSGLEAYTVTAEIMVRGNKAVENYIVKQQFKYPDKYRLEVLRPIDKKGKITIYDGSKIWIFHPQINQSYCMENFQEVEEVSMFPGYFAKNLFNGEDAVYDIKKDGSNEYVVIKVGIPGGNSYRKSQILYIDRKDTIPVKMEILDSNDNIVVTVHYKDFLCINIEDKDFKKENVPQLNKS